MHPPWQKGFSPTRHNLPASQLIRTHNVWSLVLINVNSESITRILTLTLPLTLLLADSLSVKIKDAQILNELSFEISNGTCVGILGPNGSGKTTLIRTVSGVLPYDGELTFNNKSISTWNHQQLAEYLAVVQQNQIIHFDFTVLDFILLGRLPHKNWLEGTTTSDLQVVNDILDRLKLMPLRDRLITSLSGGERQRVLLAQALVQTPKLLLLDEPTANLDIYHQLDFLNQIRVLADNGLTVLAVFHDIELAMKYADKVLVLSNGQQVAFGPSKTVITPQLLREVFHVDSRISQDSNDQLHIQYLNTL